jgi:anti-anti-sigma factor
MDLLERSAGMQSGAGKPRVILDLDGLSFVNSMGLGLLVRLNTWFTAAGGRFILYRPRSTVHDVIAVSGLRRFIAVADTTAELDVLCGEEGG